MKVRDVMTSKPATCTPQSSLSDVAKIMRDQDCGAVPVVSGNKIEGIITDRDIVVRCVADGKNVLDQDVSTCMTPTVATIRSDANLQECLDLMERQQIRRVLVMDSDDNLEGIVAQADVALHASKKDTGEVVQEVSKH